jgi:hypothetical protein
MVQHTIATIVQDSGATDRTVRTWLEKAVKAQSGEVGEIVNGTRVFSNEERDLLLSFAKPRTSTGKPEPEILEGNHRAIIEAPIVPHKYDLTHLRDSAATVRIDDPGSIATQALAMMDGLIGAMDADIVVQDQRIQETVSAREAIAEKTEELRDARLRYQIRSEIRTAQQNRETAGLQEQVGKLQKLAANPDGG